MNRPTRTMLGGFTVIRSWDHWAVLTDLASNYVTQKAVSCYPKPSMLLTRPIHFGWYKAFINWAFNHRLFILIPGWSLDEVRIPTLFMAYTNALKGLRNMTLSNVKSQSARQNCFQLFEWVRDNMHITKLSVLWIYIFVLYLCLKFKQLIWITQHDLHIKL